jgi:DNA-binding transcriptional LysR family regulator
MLVDSIKTNVPTELLRTLVTVCELGSFTKAAQLLQLTEPGVSQQIKKLEIIIGREIIDRGLSGINLTSGGAEVLKSAQQLLSINDQIVLQCGNEVGPLIVRLGVPNLYARNLLPGIVKKIRSCAPDVQMQIYCDNSPNLLRMQRLGYLDVAISYVDQKDIPDALCSWTEKIGWVRASNAPFEGIDPVPLISSPSVLQVDRVATEALRRCKRRYRIAFSAADFGARFAAVAAGLGYMPLSLRLMPPQLMVEEEALPELGHLMVGIFVRRGFEMKGLQSFVGALEMVASPGATVA